MAFIDTVENYAFNKNGHTVPLIISECGVGSETGIGFLFAHETYLGQLSLHYSLLNGHGIKANGAKAYQFCHHMGWNFQFLRIESSFDKFRAEGSIVDVREPGYWRYGHRFPLMNPHQ